MSRHKYLITQKIWPHKNLATQISKHAHTHSQASLARDRAVGVAARRAHIAELKECDQLLTVVQCMFTGLRRTGMAFDQVCVRVCVCVCVCEVGVCVRVCE